MKTEQNPFLNGFRSFLCSWRTWGVLAFLAGSYGFLALRFPGQTSFCNWLWLLADIGVGSIFLLVRIGVWLFSLVFAFTVLIVGFLFFLRMMRNASRVIYGLGILFIVGFLVYLCTPGLSRTPYEIRRHAMLRSMSAMDTVLGSFFLSRGSYDEFGGEALPRAEAAKPPGILEGEVSPQRRGSDSGEEPGSYAKRRLRALEKSPSDFVRWGREFAVLVFYYLFHTLCYAFGVAFVFRILSQHLVNSILFHALLFFRGVVRNRSWFFPDVSGLCRNLYRFLMFRIRFAKSSVSRTLGLWSGNIAGNKPIWVFWGGGEESVAVHGGNEDKAICILAQTSGSPTRTLFSGESAADEHQARWQNWIYATPDDQSSLSAKLIAEAERHWILGADSHYNVKMAARIVGRVDQAGVAKRHLYVRIDSDDNEDIAYGWVDQLAQKGAEIHLLREPEIIATSLLSKHPMPDVPGIEVARKDGGIQIKGSFRILIVGCGALGTAILRQIVQGAVYPGTKVEIDVVDSRASSFEAVREIYENEKRIWNESMQTSFSFWAMDIRSPEFHGLLRERTRTDGDGSTMPSFWNRVIIVLPEFRLSMQVAMDIGRKYREAGIFENHGSGRSFLPKDFVFIAAKTNSDAEYFQNLVKELEADGVSAQLQPATVFGSPRETYAGLADDLERGDAGARFINWCYFHMNESPMPEYDEEESLLKWRESDSFGKESSRAAASGMRNLLYLLGWRTVAPESTGDVFSKELESKIGELLDLRETKDYFARREHLRWMAFHLLRGVRSWNPDTKEITALAQARQAAVRPNDMKKRNRHAAIAPFDALPAIDEAFAEGNGGAGFNAPNAVAGTDSTFVKWLPRVLKEAGWRIVPSFEERGEHET